MQDQIETETLQKGFNPLIIILGAIIILGVIAGISYLGLSKNTKSQTQDLVTVTPTPVATTDPTANWKTYTNTKDGYSFKYPLQVAVDEIGNVNFKIENDNYAIDILPSIRPGTSLYDLKPTTIDQVIVNACPHAATEMCSSSIPGPIPNSIQFDALNRHYAGIDTIVKNGDVIYDASIGINNPNTPISAEARQIYNQILSTLKFSN